MSWRRLAVLIQGLARTPGTLLHRKLAGDDWTLDQHLLALVVDRLSTANWQRQGKRGAARPKPVSPLAQDKAGEKAGDTSGRDPDEVKRQLHAYRTGAFDHHHGR